MAELDDLAAGIAALEASLAGAQGMAAAFDAELRAMQQSLWATSREVNLLSAGIGTGLRRAFDGLVFDGLKLSDALKVLARSIVDTVYSIAMKPVQTALGGALAQGLGAAVGGLMPFAEGAGFAQGRVMPFAAGGIVTGPVAFPMRGGRGLMGEAGPEAILPLARGADGRLGVRAEGAGGARPVTVVFNVATPDVAGFERSQGQIAAQLGRMLARGQRNR